jgi:hypothetical protein
MTRRFQFSLRNLLWWMFTILMMCGAIAHLRWLNRMHEEHPDSLWNLAKGLLGTAVLLGVVRLWTKIEPPRRLQL